MSLLNRRTYRHIRNFLLYYVYKLIDPRTKQPFYVGKGKGDRAQQHLSEARRSPDKWDNKKKCEYIRALWDRGLEVVIELESQHLTEEAALELELQLIEKYGRLCNGSGILTNIHAHNCVGPTGGVPVVAYTITGAIVKSFPSLTAAGEHYGIHKSTICSALNKRSFLAAGLRWFHADEPFVYTPNPKGTKVDQYDFDGNFIATFAMTKNAASSVNVNQSHIADCCAGRNVSAGGFQWAYHGELPPTQVGAATLRTSIIRELVAYDDNGCEFGVYGSVKEAIAATSANSTGISDCAAGRKKTSGGLSWKWRQKERA